jgi:uncharacterized C2H2 Zn-finger protein
MHVSAARREATITRLLDRQKIRIPCDNDGYVLLRCPHCGEFFKATPSDISDEAVIDLRCPACGLTSDNFLTQDVIDLAVAKASNWAMREIDDALNAIGRKPSAKGISIEIKSHHDEMPEMPLTSSIDSLMPVRCRDCGRPSKISPLLAMSVYICPYCGIGQFNER